MNKRFLAALVVVVVGAGAPARAAEDYVMDIAHAGVNFKIAHLGLSWIHGRFNDFSGTFTIDPADPAKCMFNMLIKTESIDTGNAKRDGHLRSPDFFNVKQFPTITFQSTAVKAVKDGYQVTGNLAMHGETKSIVFIAVGGRKAEFPKGMQRTGFSTELILRRAEFGVGSPNFAQALGDEVHIAISFEGTKK